MQLPTINACLNFTSAVLLLAGYFFIRRNNMKAHRLCMSLALCASAAFLSCYLYYHYQVGSKHFEGVGPIRTVYFTILLTHTVLAVVIVPMIFATVMKAVKGNFEGHRRLARWTWPLWMYVSVTGVVIYWMLYR